jgi:hypothetical protein
MKPERKPKEVDRTHQQPKRAKEIDKSPNRWPITETVKD